MKPVNFILTNARAPMPKPWATKTFTDLEEAKSAAFEAAVETGFPVTVTEIIPGGEWADVWLVIAAQPNISLVAAESWLEANGRVVTYE